jgi:tRNA threonylcarbamoyladenosine biosynthesis protein TsaB
MRLLALDTALGACSAAIMVDGVLAARRHEVMARGHAERLLPMAEEALAEAGIAWSALDRLAVSIGPGTFTGVRTGLAAARGLALALDRPLLGFTSLAIVAEGARALGAGQGRVLVVALDAHGGHLYVQGFAGDASVDVPGGLAAPGLMTPAAAAGLLAGAALDLAGDGAAVLAAALGTQGTTSVTGPELPDAADLARLAAAAPAPERPYVAPAPLYLRAPHADLPAPRAARPG